MKRDEPTNVPGDECTETVALNRELLKENAELKIQVSHLQKEVARLKEAHLDGN